MNITSTTRRAALVAACAFGLSAAALAPVSAQNDDTSGNPITVEVNGTAVNLSAAQPQMLGGRVMVPVRGVFERLGGKVQWEPDDRAVTGSKADGANPFRMQVGSPEALLNGEKTQLEASPRLVSESVYVPLRFVSEALGAKVEWDAARRAVRIVPAAAETNANAAMPPSETHDNRASSAPGESSVAAANPPGPDAATSGSETTSSSDERGDAAAGAMVGGAGSGSGPSSSNTTNGDTAQMERAAPAGTTRPATPDTNTTAVTTEDTAQSPLSRYLPWILGAVVLLGLLGYLATRNKAGQVIASGENVSDTKSRRS